MAKEYKKKINSAQAMADAWEQYKEICDNKTVTRTEFSQRTSSFVTAVIPSPVTYTIKGFCIYIGMTEQNFFATYTKNRKFELVIARMKEECEADARQKFENGTINSRLAGLWMSHYGYSTKSESKEEIKNSVVIVDDLDE
jgi:hypothetical protein